jgi:hypothetical protein
MPGSSRPGVSAACMSRVNSFSAAYSLLRATKTTGTLCWAAVHSPSAGSPVRICPNGARAASSGSAVIAQSSAPEGRYSPSMNSWYLKIAAPKATMRSCSSKWLATVAMPAGRMPRKLGCRVGNGHREGLGPPGSLRSDRQCWLTCAPHGQRAPAGLSAARAVAAGRRRVAAGWRRRGCPAHRGRTGAGPRSTTGARGRRR